ncbi:DUF5801 domain-containing protein [Kiloniella laminariae]|uniref:DUF5801 domain-containing protein n=1 Tax=Kiloniella laminariae TaxID=454162 RepID=A0ABT4LEP4_9PROT|nr:DUF5801 repeats-in-toxin domain-containing protein [Kiloniella laminariae]MCZ4279569.1 DUF5801 domain-containing protein [Kiloniella laminariae]
MTDHLTQGTPELTSTESTSGSEGRDYVVGQAAAVVVAAPTAAGQTIEQRLESGQQAVLDFDAAAATPSVDGDNFVLSFDSNGDGAADSQLVFLGLVSQAQGADAPVLVINGIEIAANQLIGQALALADGDGTLETAAGGTGAGNGPAGGGGSTYSDDLGENIDLLNAQGALGGTELGFGLLADGEDISDPAEGTFDITFLSVQTEVPGDGGEDGDNFVSGSFSGGFEDWQPNQHLGDESRAPMQVQFNFTPADNETLDSVVINALPDGVTLYIGGSDAANVYGGTFPVTILPEDYDAIFILPPADSDADITVNAVANISDPDSGDSASIPATAVAVVDAAADKPVFGDGGLSGDGLVDMYLLQDLTGSFRDDLANVKSAISGLIAKINGDAFTADVRLGAGSFKDKPLDPYGDDSDYVFQNAENVTDDLAAVQSAVDGFSATGGNDGPEAQIEALLNLAQNAGDLGFRSGASKYVVLTTDNSFHKAGDASGLGANDGDGDLTADLDEDYPSLAQLKAALADSGIVPIFMATSSYVAEYQALVDFLGVGEVHELTSDSSNLLANILSAGGAGSDSNVYDEQAEVTVPVNVTFGDYTDGSEVHTIVLSGIPSDWIPTFAYAYTVDGLAAGQNPGDIGLNTTYSITIDVTDLDDVGGLVDIDLTFNPQDWTSSRWSDGSSHDDGDATIGLKAIAEETNLSGDELTDLNNRAETEGSHTIRVVEDIPEVQGVTFTHDETRGVDAGSGDVAPLNAAVAAALIASTVGVHGSVIGQAEAEVSYDFKTDGPGTPTDASDVGTEKLQFEDYNSVEVTGMTAGGDADPSAIFLSRDDANPNIVWGLDDEGNAVFSVHLEQPTASSGTATMTFVQYQQINHTTDGDNSAGEHDDALSLVLSYVAIDGEGDVSTPATATITIEDDGPAFTANDAQEVDLSEVAMPPVGGIYSLVGVTEPVTVELAKIAHADSAGYNSSYGYFFVDTAGEPISGTVLWDNVKHEDGLTDSFTIDPSALPAGAVGFGFFLIPNGDSRNGGLGDDTDVTFKQVDGKWTAFVGDTALKGSGAPAFFSKPDLNPDGGQDHEVDNNLPGNSNWEDLLIPAGDGDFNDVNINVVVKGAPCAHVSGALSFDVGTDLAGASLKLVDEVSDVTSAGEAVTATLSADGSQIVGMTAAGEVVYVVTLKDVDLANGSAKYDFVQFRQIDHAGAEDAVLPVKFSVTLTDGDADTTTTNIVINLTDSGPTAATARVIFDETEGNQGNQERNLTADDRAAGMISKATQALAFDFGKDHVNGKVALTDKDGNAFDGAVSDLTDTLSGEKIYLYSEGDQVVGRVGTGGAADANGEIAFKASLDQMGTHDAADFVIEQFRAFKHTNTNSHNEQTSLDDIHYVVTDGDGDKTTAQKITINIKDDGPSIDSVYNNDDDLEESDLTWGDHKDAVYGKINANFGVDGGKFTGLELKSVTDPDGTAGDAVAPGFDGNLTSNGVAVMFGPAVVIGGKLTLVGQAGDAEVIKVELNEASGSFKVTLLGPIDHPDQNGGQQVGSADQLRLNFTATVTDGDGDTASKDFSVRIKDDGPDADDTRNGDHLHENTVQHAGSDKITGYLRGDFGGDGAGSAVITSLAFVEANDLPGDPHVAFTSGGEPVRFIGPVDDGNGNMVLKGVIGPNGSETSVITLTVNTTTRYYEIVLHEAVDHPNDHRTGYSDELEPHFNFVLTDADGDTSSAQLYFHITDDGVVARDDANTADAVQEDLDTTAVGNVLTNDDQGADGAVVTTTAAMVGTYGTVTIDANGDYTYVLNNGAANVQALAAGEVVYDSFTYRMEDADGDHDTATLKIKITGNNDAPVAVADGVDVVYGGVDVLTKADPSDAETFDFGVQNAGKSVKVFFEATTGGSWDPVGHNQDTFTVKINGVEVLVTHDRGTKSYSFDATIDNEGKVTVDFSATITGDDESLTVNGLNVTVPSIFTDENASVVIDVLANDTDVDHGDSPATFSLDAASFASGVPAVPTATATISGNKLVFNPGTDFDYLADGETATVVIDYTMSDDSGAASSSTATIIVTGTNDAPVAVDDIVLTNVTSGAVVIPDWALLKNDTDVDSELQVGGVSNPVDGTVSHTAGAASFTLDSGTDLSSLGFATSGSVRTINEVSGDGFKYNWFFGDWVSGTEKNSDFTQARQLWRGSWVRDDTTAADVVVHKIMFEGSLDSARDYDYRFGPNYDNTKKDRDAFRVTLLAGEVLSLGAITAEGNPDFKLYSASNSLLDSDFKTGSYTNTTGTSVEVYVRVEDNASIGRDTGRSDDYSVELKIDSTAIVSPSVTEGSFDYTAVDGHTSDGATVSVEVQDSSTITGTAADEILIGGNGADTLIGNGGDDTLLGNGGDDILLGGAGDDILVGGTGADRFVFKADTLGDTDTIKDFNTADGDVLDLGELLSGFSAGVDNDATATALQDYLSIANDGAHTIITVDADGSGAGTDVTTIRLENIDLLGGGLDQHDAIKALLDSGNLDVV